MVEAKYAGHWLTVASNRRVDEVCDLVGGGFSQVEEIGGFNQPRSRCHESGARVYFGSRRAGQPTVLNLPGEVCEHWFDQGLEWASLGWITRVDLACDVHPAESARFRMLQLRREWKSKRCETHIRRFSETRSDPPEGWTQYYGSSQSALRTRVYDRRGPLRIEKQWRPKREVGEVLAPVIARRGVAPTWRSLSTDLQFKRLTWYQDLLAGDRVQLPTVEEEETTWAKFIDELQLQYGPTFWALLQMGMKLDDLAVEPEAPIDGKFASSWLRRADEAEQQGYDVEQLRREIRCKLKS